MTSRDEILARLRGVRRASAPHAPVPRDGDVFADMPDGDLLERFRSELELLKGEVVSVADEAAAARALRELLESAEPGPWLAQRAPLVDAVLAADESLGARLDRDDALALDSPALAHYAVGISVCDALVARTGGVVLQSVSAAGRRLSALPPLHVVLARRDQLVASLDESLARVGSDSSWSFATIITGPSRTADIEKILVLGAHGPKRLAVVVLGP